MNLNSGMKVVLEQVAELGRVDQNPGILFLAHDLVELDRTDLLVVMDRKGFCVERWAYIEPNRRKLRGIAEQDHLAVGARIDIRNQVVEQRAVGIEL
jgi:hypothetical protein